MSEAVRAFFSQWDIYRLCIEHNTLFHREVGAILRRELQEQSRPFTFLDLACGDAEVTAAALRETKVTAYTGVDFSAPAIALATEKTAALACPCRFREQDFTHFLRYNKEKFDLIFLGLSLHHLETAAKREMMQYLRSAMADGGSFYLLEPILQAGESREGYTRRWSAAMDGPYDSFPPAARDALREHVRQSERPESVEEYLAAAHAAGFLRGEVLFSDHGNFYSLFRFKVRAV